jgi:hypothetical protein
MLGRIKLDRFLVVVLLLIFLLALGVRISLIVISPRVAPSYGMITPIGGDEGRYLSELCGRTMLYSCLQFSIGTLASISIVDTSRFSSSSRMLLLIATALHRPDNPLCKM